MYKVIRENGFKDLQDSTKHVYKKGDFFPYDQRDIKESRILELSSDLNKLKEPIIELVSSLEQKTKEEIIKQMKQEQITLPENMKKTSLIYEYEYQKSRHRLLDEVTELNLSISEEKTNMEIAELIINSNKN